MTGIIADNEWGKQSQLHVFVGCAYCLKVMTIQTVVYYEDRPGAWCPHCDIDALSYTTNPVALQQLHDKMFVAPTDMESHDTKRHPEKA